MSFGEMDFPQEIVKAVLCHLSLDDLKNCLLVSKEIREMIIKTPQLMRKFDVILLHETWKDKLPFIEKYGFFIRSLKFQAIGFDSENQFRKILKGSPNIERLTFIDCYIREPEEDRNEPNAEQRENVPQNNQENPNEVNNEEQNMQIDGEQNNHIAENNVNDQIVTTNEKVDSSEDFVLETEIDLNLLTYLHLESSTIAENLIKFIKNCNKLKYLKLTFYYQEPKTEFTSFVCQQDNLEELNLQGYSDMIYKSLFNDADMIEKANFHLKRLALECELSFQRNFSNFFRAQAKYIKDLEISCYNIDFHFYRVLFNDFQKLKKLEMPTDWALNDSRARVIGNCRIPSVRELKLVGSNDDYETFKTFINIFPNIESLKCENLSSISLHGILENLHNLTFIHVDTFRCDSLLFVSLPSLKTLEIVFLCPTGNKFYWERLTTDCPNIEYLYIDDIGNIKLNASFKFEFRIILQNLVNLKNLKICRIVCCPSENSLNPDHDDNERIDDTILFFRVDINMSNKTIKLSNHFIIHCNEEVEMLREIFKECDISEF